MYLCNVRAKLTLAFPKIVIPVNVAMSEFLSTIVIVVQRDTFLDALVTLQTPLS